MEGIDTHRAASTGLGGSRSRSPHHAGGVAPEFGAPGRALGARRHYLERAVDVLGSEPARGGRAMTRTSRHTGALSALGAGLGAAAARPWLVATLWSWHLVL